MTFITRNLSKVTDNLFGMDRPQMLFPTPPTNTAIELPAQKSKGENIRSTPIERNRSDAGGAYGAGQSGIALDPLGRRGAGFVAGHKSLLGR